MFVYFYKNRYLCFSHLSIIFINNLHLFILKFSSYTFNCQVPSNLNDYVDQYVALETFFFFCPFSFLKNSALHKLFEL